MSTINDREGPIDDFHIVFVEIFPSQQESNGISEIRLVNEFLGKGFVKTKGEKRAKKWARQ